MRVAYAFALLNVALSDGLSHPKFIVKSRSVVSLETASGVKASVPVEKKYEKETFGVGTNSVKQPYSGKPSLVLVDPNKNYDEEYWYHPQIHTLGNVGILGAVHAALAPLSTHLIDNLAYGGVDIRMKVSVPTDLKLELLSGLTVSYSLKLSCCYIVCRKVAKDLRDLFEEGDARVLDLCCGVGYSTRALRRAFPEAKAVIGLDTSPQMVSMANFLTKHFAIVMPWFQHLKKRFSVGVALLEEQQGKMKATRGRIFRGVHFKKGNAEMTNYSDQSFDLITVMYAFHEAPKKGREQIIKEARRLLSPGGVLAIVDISSDYEPSPNMLAGEPYVKEYQQNIGNQLQRKKGFLRPEYKTVVPGHVVMWTLRRSSYAV